MQEKEDHIYTENIINQIDTTSFLLKISPSNTPNKSTYLNRGHWKPIQNYKYKQFLLFFKQHFKDKEVRRTKKIFIQMANYIQTRAADQCRSHHQKMQKKCGSLQQIIKHLSIYVGIYNQDISIIKQKEQNLKNQQEGMQRSDSTKVSKQTQKNDININKNWMEQDYPKVPLFFQPVVDFQQSFN